ncbi:glycosyltransferase family 25 protein [Zasmidium cellare ATCC 36951]|uniref:Glycosyltransferase family 25 protein n=1 Tax=Zasmidium cellare ATCC 36951 TaxID=1080233 RepID=A0A6A6CDT2_ZASCE|nr:glycosyltransferase family 25 protein [Zasmidium cellare ATCC 36951]KAF2165354.1 glycosyltransferase family 25 protein [Zasmidium cellare ATCC 36951]
MVINQLLSRRSVLLYTSVALLLVFYLSYQWRSTRSAETAPSEPLLPQDHEVPRFQKIFVINLPSRTDRRYAASLAAALTDLDIENANGDNEVDKKSLPPGAKEVNMSKGAMGAWRAHTNIARTMIEQRISSALILEDDADWDTRIKRQMRDFAKASRLLVQPLPGTTNEFLDPTWPQPDAEHSDINVQLGRAVISDDETVPPRRSINIEFGDTQLLDQYPDYTRVVARSRVNTCTLGYALSQNGARQLLAQVGMWKIDGMLDMMMRSACDGPALFNHHRPVGPRSSWSNINKEDDQGYNDMPLTTNIRWATRVNLAKLMLGETDHIDSYGD